LEMSDTTKLKGSLNTIEEAIEAIRNGEFVIVERESVAGSVTDRRKVFHVEGFVPVVGSSWFLVISASVPEVGMVSDVRAVVERMIQSLRVYPDITDQPLTQEFGHEAGDAYFTSEGAVLVSEGV